MNSPESKSQENLPEHEVGSQSALESSETLDVPALQKELAEATQNAIERGAGMLDAAAQKAEIQALSPELQEQVGKIKAEARNKLRGLDVSLGRLKERVLSTINLITGGLFEKERHDNTEGAKIFSGFFRDSNGLGVTKSERERLESEINVEFIRERARDVQEYLKEKIASNQVVLLGEIHTSETVEKRAVADLLKLAKLAGTTHVGLEIPEYFQVAVDNFMETGKFIESDNPSDYEKVDEYHRLFREQLVAPKEAKIGGPGYDERGLPVVAKQDGQTDEMFNFERSMRKNFLFRNNFDKDYHLIKKIREAGLVPVCLDANATYGTSSELDTMSDALGRDGGGVTFDDVQKKEYDLEQKRDVFMAQKIQSVVDGGGKMLAILGNAHVRRGGIAERENVADLFAGTGVNIAAINLDRDCDEDSELTHFKKSSDDQSSSNSILYSKIKGEAELSGKSFGIDLEPEIMPRGDRAPYDGYVYLPYQSD